MKKNLHKPFKNFTNRIKNLFFYNKFLFCFFVLSFYAIISYILIKCFLKISDNQIWIIIDIIGNIFIACFCSYIFFIFQIFIPEEKNKNLIKKSFYTILLDVSRSMKQTFENIFFISNKEFNTENCTREIFEEISKNLNLSKNTNLNNVIYYDGQSKFTKLTLKETLIYYSNKIDNDINKALFIGIKFMDTEIIALLENILTSEFHHSFCKETLNFVDGIPFKNEPAMLAEMIFSYFEFYKKLEIFVKQSKVFAKANRKYKKL